MQNTPATIIISNVSAPASVHHLQCIILSASHTVHHPSASPAVHHLQRIIHGRTNGRMEEGVPRGPRGPKKATFVQFHRLEPWKI